MVSSQCATQLCFDETNFMTSEQETGDFKIGVADLDDEELIQKEQDQEEQQQVQNQKKYCQE